MKEILKLILKEHINNNSLKPYIIKIGNIVLIIAIFNGFRKNHLFVKGFPDKIYIYCSSNISNEYLLKGIDLFIKEIKKLKYTQLFVKEELYKFLVGEIL